MSQFAFIDFKEVVVNIVDIDNIDKFKESNEDYLKQFSEVYELKGDNTDPQIGYIKVGDKFEPPKDPPIQESTTPRAIYILSPNDTIFQITVDDDGKLLVSKGEK